MNLSDSYKLHIAVAALKRIQRTVITTHAGFSTECRCPKCEATNALEEIREDSK